MLIKQIKSMLALQDTMNSKVNPEWRTAGYPWHRAIFIETAEFMEHLGWKWWKAQAPDMTQAQIELVDIWHFMLSEAIINTESFDRAATLLHFRWHQFKLDFYPNDTLRLAEMFAAGAVQNKRADILLFRELCAAVDLDDDTLYKMYVAKNVLNIFRQDNGYKAGAYIKTWHGQEDNVWLARVMEENPLLGPDELRLQLTRDYADVLESQPN
jgi:dimeric dUTPase (all-alpha-NTP-PPase superfamily)